ncbi:hypothetical protein CKC_00725 [Candidatus Liberibacter solanacearum CLso-ZC1]|uniref:Uncharacterized protein n=1 Tax=Liberibacter solanacearum (strain CLso-ZC1) TaxID=658172 RepID=E4UC06_LIBSC|nr:hypothetical protein CKC_00725 [Candidatus Liberibacter solanacearum CLso-ZC1]
MLWMKSFPKKLEPIWQKNNITAMKIKYHDGYSR